MEVSARLYENGDEDEIVSVLTTVFEYWRRHPSPLDYWRWRYVDSPVKKNIISLGVSEGKIVGCAHNNSIMVKLNDRTGLGYLVGSAAVLPTYQGKGVYNKIRGLHNDKRANMGAIMNFWITNNPILVESDKRMGYYPFPFKIKQYVKIRDINEYFRNRNTRNSFIKKIAYKINTSINTKHPDTENLTIVEVAHFPEEVNEIWEKNLDDYSFIIERNREYLNWRYCDHRGGDYLTLFAYIENVPVGFIVLTQRTINNNLEGFIVDYFIDTEYTKYLPELLYKGTDKLLSIGVDRVSCWCIESSMLEKYIKSVGFQYDYTDIYIGMEITSDDFLKLKLASPDRVHLVYGDIETL